MKQVILKWMELRIGTVYKTTEIKPIETNYGPGTILKMHIWEEEEEIEVWAPKRPAVDICGTPHPRYVHLRMLQDVAMMPPLWRVPCPLTITLINLKHCQLKRKANLRT